MLGVIYSQLFKKAKHRYPKGEVPSIKTDLNKLDPKANVLVWFGHSSYFLQWNGKKLLVDPVFSGNASPIPRTIRSSKGTDIYSAADIPPIDCLFITHDKGPKKIKKDT